MSELSLRKYGHWSGKGWLVEILCSWHRVRYQVVEEQAYSSGLGPGRGGHWPPGGPLSPSCGPVSLSTRAQWGGGRCRDAPGGWSRQGMTRAGTQRGNSREDERPAERLHTAIRSQGQAAKEVTQGYQSRGEGRVNPSPPGCPGRGAGLAPHLLCPVPRPSEQRKMSKRKPPNRIEAPAPP